MTMSQERFNELDANGGTLTPAEQAAGWHYCPEFDFMLTMGEGPGPCPCGIHGDSPLQLTRDPEPHGSRDTFVPPPVKSDIELLREKLISMDAIKEIDLGGCPPDKTDEEMIAALIECKAESDAYDKNLAQEMKAALDSLTEEDLIRPQDPDLVDAVYEPTYAEHVDLIAKAKEYLATVKAIVHQHDGQWYFWEETYSQRIGPYSTEIAANKALDHYCDVVLGQGREPA